MSENRTASKDEQLALLTTDLWSLLSFMLAVNWRPLIGSGRVRRAETLCYGQPPESLRICLRAVTPRAARAVRGGGRSRAEPAGRRRAVFAQEPGLSGLHVARRRLAGGRQRTPLPLRR